MDFDSNAQLNLGEYTEGGGGVPPSIVTDDWMNALTNELINIITAGGGTPNIAVHNQAITAINALIASAVAALVAASPAALDTLNELAAALGDDANFATTVNNALALKAPLASPAFTATPVAPTAVNGTNTTQLATTAFVQAAIGLLGSVYAAVSHSHSIANVTSLQTTLDGKAPTSHSHTIASVTSLQSSLDAKAPLAAPTFTGIPAAPTAAAGTNSTQLATTAFVKALGDLRARWTNSGFNTPTMTLSAAAPPAAGTAGRIWMQYTP